MVAKALLAKRQKFAALIKKGREDYPEVKHIRGDWIRFDDEKPSEACAVGFAMLGKWDGKINEENVSEYQDKIGIGFHYTSGPYKDDTAVPTEVMGLNDDRLMSLDQIIAQLESGE